MLLANPTLAVAARPESGVRLANDANTALPPVAGLRPDRDVNIMAERGQQAHQAFAGEV